MTTKGDAVTIRPAVEIPNVSEREFNDIRLVKAHDAELMQETPGLWYQIQNRRGNANGVWVASSRLRRDLPRWYSGVWEVMSRRGGLYARYVGP